MSVPGSSSSCSLWHRHDTASYLLSPSCSLFKDTACHWPIIMCLYLHTHTHRYISRNIFCCFLQAVQWFFDIIFMQVSPKPVRLYVSPCAVSFTPRWCEWYCLVVKATAVCHSVMLSFVCSLVSEIYNWTLNNIQQNKQSSPVFRCAKVILRASLNSFFFHSVFDSSFAQVAAILPVAYITNHIKQDIQHVTSLIRDSSKHIRIKCELWHHSLSNCSPSSVNDQFTGNVIL